MATLRLESPFPPEECQRRLAAATESDTLTSNWTFREGVLAKLSDARFRLRLRRRFVRNSFSRLLYGSYETTTAGSLITLRIRLHPFVLAFTIVWFAFLVLWTVLVVALMIAQLVSGQHRSDSNPWPTVLMAPVLALFGFLLVRSGRTDAEYLIRFLERVLNARPEESRAA